MVLGDNKPHFSRDMSCLSNLRQQNGLFEKSLNNSLRRNNIHRTPPLSLSISHAPESDRKSLMTASVINSGVVTHSHIWCGARKIHKAR